MELGSDREKGLRYRLWPFNQTTPQAGLRRQDRLRERRFPPLLAEGGGGPVDLWGGAINDPTTSINNWTCVTAWTAGERERTLLQLAGVTAPPGRPSG